VEVSSFLAQGVLCWH